MTKFSGKREFCRKILCPCFFNMIFFFSFGCCVADPLARELKPNSSSSSSSRSSGPWGLGLLCHLAFQQFRKEPHTRVWEAHTTAGTLEEPRTIIWCFIPLWNSYITLGTLHHSLQQPVTTVRSLQPHESLAPLSREASHRPWGASYHRQEPRASPPVFRRQWSTHIGDVTACELVVCTGPNDCRHHWSSCSVCTRFTALCLLLSRAHPQHQTGRPASPLFNDVILIFIFSCLI